VNIKCHMSPNSSCFIELRSSHIPFSLSHTTTTPFSTPFPMQTMHHPPTPHTILTNHTPPTNPPLTPILHVNVEPQPNTFPIPLNNAHVKPSPPFIISTLIVCPWSNPLTYPQSSQHAYNLHLKPFAPLAASIYPSRVNLSLTFLSGI